MALNNLQCLMCHKTQPNFYLSLFISRRPTLLYSADDKFFIYLFIYFILFYFNFSFPSSMFFAFYLYLNSIRFLFSLNTFLSIFYTFIFFPLLFKLCFLKHLICLQHFYSSVHTYTHTHIYIYIYIYIYISCHAISTDIPDPLWPLFRIVHYSRQILRATSRISTEL